MELLELVNETKQIFEINDINELGDKLLNQIIDNDYSKIEQFAMLDGKTNVQKIYQYYLADRDNLKQDFTPPTLCKLVSKLCDDERVIDMCAGVGSLSIDKEYIEAYEFNEKTIPFLLLNMIINNKSGFVHHADVLSDEIFKTYRIQKGEKYATVGI